MVHKTMTGGEGNVTVSSTRQKSGALRTPRQQSRNFKGAPGGIPFLVKKLINSSFDRPTIDLIMDAWRPSTKKVYTTYLRKWVVFCVSKNIKLLNPTLPQVCTFLRNLSVKGLGYGALNAARSALSLILPHVDGTTIGKHPTVCWLIKGAYERNPPRPKYEVFWDVNKVFTMFKEWPTNSSLSLKHLTWKLAVLLLLVTSQRGQTILNLSIKNLELANPVVFKMQKLLKHNRLGDPLDCITLQRFPECPKLCVVRTLKTHLKRTSKIRKDDQLLLAYVQPHRAISRDTLARWTLVVLQQAGVSHVICHIL